MAFEIGFTHVVSLTDWATAQGRFTLNCLESLRKQVFFNIVHFKQSLKSIILCLPIITLSCSYFSVGSKPTSCSEFSTSLDGLVKCPVLQHKCNSSGRGNPTILILFGNHGQQGQCGEKAQSRYRHLRWGTNCSTFLKNS